LLAFVPGAHPSQRPPRSTPTTVGAGRSFGRPATTSHPRRRSSTEPASRPGPPIPGARGIIPSGDTPRCVGFRPQVPQKAAGILAEPPVSETRLIGTMPVATATAEPPLEPPLILVGSQGFRVGPQADSR